MELLNKNNVNDVGITITMLWFIKQDSSLLLWTFDALTVLKVTVLNFHHRLRSFLYSYTILEEKENQIRPHWNHVLLAELR